MNLRVLSAVPLSAWVTVAEQRLGDCHRASRFFPRGALPELSKAGDIADDIHAAFAHAAAPQPPVFD